MTKEQICCVKDGLSRQKLFIALECIELLEKENEEIKQQVSYLEDNLRVARKDRENLQDAVANGLEEFIKKKPHTSLRFLANKELKEENEHIRRLLGTAIIVLNRIENPEVPYAKVVDNLRKLKELLGSVE